jgi:drug/metabolite transporter (DMT)-like permease
VVAAVLCLPVLLAGTLMGADEIAFAMPTGVFWIWVFCVGLAATISHMAMTYALAFTPSATLAPLHYLEIVTATLFGFLFFGDFPGGLTWGGIGIIVASGLYVIHRERVSAQRPG